MQNHTLKLNSLSQMIELIQINEQTILYYLFLEKPFIKENRRFRNLPKA